MCNKTTSVTRTSTTSAALKPASSSSSSSADPTAYSTKPPPSSSSSSSSSARSSSSSSRRSLSSPFSKPREKEEEEDPMVRVLLSVIGIIVSAYASYVEYKMEHKAPDEEYTALCDIEMISASCSNVFILPQGRMLSYFGIVPAGHPTFDVPNAYLGCILYTYMLLFGNNKNSIIRPLTNLMITMAFASSVFLAYQLTYVVQEFCIVCWTTHGINSMLFYQLMNEFKSGSSSGGSSSSPGAGDDDAAFKTTKKNI